MREFVLERLARLHLRGHQGSRQSGSRLRGAGMDHRSGVGKVPTHGTVNKALRVARRREAVESFVATSQGTVIVIRDEAGAHGAHAPLLSGSRASASPTRRRTNARTGLPPASGRGRRGLLVACGSGATCPFEGVERFKSPFNEFERPADHKMMRMRPFQPNSLRTFSRRRLV